LIERGRVPLVHRLLVEHGRFAQAVEIVGDAVGGAAAATRAGVLVAHLHETVCVRPRQRTQHDVVDDRKEHHVGRDAEREGRDAREREGPVAQQEADGETEIVQHFGTGFSRAVVDVGWGFSPAVDAGAKAPAYVHYELRCRG
jgi:hypothetical protein